MCGINCVALNNNADRIQEMNSVISHRGPDHCGIFEASPDVALSLSRLAILDPTTSGNQPMTYQGCTIAYNGEVYNYQELREELEGHGYKFDSTTDTEVVLKGYIEYGSEFLKRLNGIIALVIFDETTETLTLFRDRLGIKPLYYYQTEYGLIISSEIAPIRDVFEEFDYTIDAIAANSYLTSRTIKSESLFEEINAVPPGYLLRYDLESYSLEREQLVDVFNGISVHSYRRRSQVNEETLVDELDHLLNEVVKRQLVADVPVAAICSGGVDSSLLAAIAAQYTKNLDLYHVSVAHPEFDEREHAEKVADYLDLDLHVEKLDSHRFNSRLDDCIYHNGLPPVHINTVGMGLIFERVREDGVKVLLTGEGADELFGGYGRYKGFYYLMQLNRFNFLAHLLKRLPNGEQLPFTFLNSKEAILNNFLTDRYSLNEANIVSRERQTKLDSVESLYSHIEDSYKRTSMSYMASELMHFLPPLLRRTDRMSMRRSVEARVPYLDNEMIDFGLNLPHRYKIYRGETKYLLKKVAERYLPSEIVYRDKAGFHIPISEWITNPITDLTDDRDFPREFYARWRSVV
jgi:asparagine synthase (glutamine-hydrolysing)